MKVIISNCCDDCDFNARVRERLCVQAEAGSSEWRRDGVLMVDKRKQATRKSVKLMRKPRKERRGKARRGEAERGISEVLESEVLRFAGNKPFQMPSAAASVDDDDDDCFGYIIRATSHTRLRALDHYTSSTLIGGKGGAGPRLLHTTLEGPTEYVNARWM